MSNTHQKPGLAPQHLRIISFIFTQELSSPVAGVQEFGLAPSFSLDHILHLGQDPVGLAQGNGISFQINLFN